MGVTSNTLSPEDHDQTFASEFGYTKVFGGGANDYFATLEPEYGTGYPIEFNSGATGRLPPHLIWNGSIGRKAGHDKRKTPGFDLTVTNFTNDRYLLKVENGFNTTQWGQGFKADLRLTMPF
jgi:hypothetical protein